MTTQTATEYRVPRTLDTARAWLASGRRQATAALALYVVISIGYFGLHVLPHLGSATVGLRNWTDPTVNIWSLAWWPYALLHGLNPLVTHALFAPDRIDLAATSPTLCPLAGILGAPITIAFGPIVSYNLLMLASPVLAAFFAFLLCRYITGNFVASLFGGYVFGFSTYILGHMEGHLQLVLIFPIPAAVHLILRLIDERISQRRFIVLMALLLAALFLTASELTLTFVALGAVALAVAFALAPAKREHIIRTVKPILAAGAAAVIVTSPVIYYELHGIVRFGSNIGDIDGSDALGFLVPPNLVRLGYTHFEALARAYNLSGSDAEAVTYVGLPLALIVARYTITRWRPDVDEDPVLDAGDRRRAAPRIAPAHRGLQHDPASVEAARPVVATRRDPAAPGGLHVPDCRGDRRHVVGAATYRKMGPGQMGGGGREHRVPGAQRQRWPLARPGIQPGVLHHPSIPKRPRARGNRPHSAVRPARQQHALAGRHGHVVPFGRRIYQSGSTRRITRQTLFSPPCFATPGRIRRRCALFSPVGTWAP